MVRGRLFPFVLAALFLGYVKGDEDIYIDSAISSTWQDWSWGSTISYTATDVKDGTSSISVNSGAYSALSLYDTSIFANTFAGLKFDLAGDNPDISIYLTDTATSVNSDFIALSAFGLNTTASALTSFTLDFSNIPPNGASLPTGNWNRITFQSGGNGAVEIVVTPEFLSAEPLGANLVAVTTKGAVDLTSVKFTLNGKALTSSANTTYVPADTPAKTITYFTLSSPFAAGTLAIAAGTATFSYTLTAGLVSSTYRTINPLIYGVNFATDTAYVKDIGVSISRWGGNAVTAYNPFGGFTNAGADWFFENRNIDYGSADDWLGWVKACWCKLAWVAKDATSYSYSAAVYPNQAKYDPLSSRPVSQNVSYVPWSTANVTTWLKGLVNKPAILAIDNEMEIAHSTHQDMHPAPVSYDEELATYDQPFRPAQVAMPSTCAWWFYWTSAVGYTDNTAHNNTDWLPYFLQKMKANDASVGKRTLDYLDIHYYFAPDTSANDDAAKALRMRMTRSLWDTTYVDESWIGTSTPQSHQPNATIVQLIPRMQSLIAANYPWNQALHKRVGIHVDGRRYHWRLRSLQTPWVSSECTDSMALPTGEHRPRTSPVGLAYWLYRGAGNVFGDRSAKFTVTGFNPNVLGVYAGTTSASKPSLVIVNKDLAKPVSLNISGFPTGKYFIRHFGGLAGQAKFQTTQTISSFSYFVVPAGTAVFIKYQG
ncbi:glycoside hydrolase family 44-domain-containing protein [Flagelloscypha sp. PMI_526]|nr:glycoside hydrolase family 44-domain-containing protein [Flagelloscypha sp. PMI_526]